MSDDESDEGTCRECGADEVELFGGLCFKCYEERQEKP